eukprot:TRINITY_DN1554_c0_g1_i2.p1 TRINITY_DN1554_c0_g1~~TRINITY_DN1554_c0_g1_i2.p1  ORF type:complete len:569 (-),score=80.21 TRINITY_DN1554_c0_g1_i2:473-2179(-)
MLGSIPKDEFQQFLVETLRKICTADPNVLADYVRALLQRDSKLSHKMRDMLKLELRDFLHKETDDFVDTLFIWLERALYRQDDVNQRYRHRDDNFANNYQHDERRFRNQKRKYDHSYQAREQPAFKRQRRYTPAAPRNEQQVSAADFSAYMKARSPVHQIYPQNRDHMYPRPSHQRNLSHGQAPHYFAPPVQYPQHRHNPHEQHYRTQTYHQRNSPKPEHYSRPAQRSPDKPEKKFGQHHAVPLEQKSGATPTSTVNSVPNQPNSHQAQPKSVQRNQQNKPGRVRNPTQNIIVRKLPDEFNNIESLNSHFKKFGTIVNIQIKRANKTAFIEFADVSMALAAFRSSEPVFQNRFIQVSLNRKNNKNKNNAQKKKPNPPPKRGSATGGPQVPKKLPPLLASLHKNPGSYNKTLSNKPPAAALPVKTADLPPNVAMQKKIIQKQKDFVEQLSNMKPSEDKTKLVQHVAKLTDRVNNNIKQEVENLKAKKAAKSQDSAKVSTTDKPLEKTVNAGSTDEDVQSDLLSKKVEQLKKQADAMGIDTSFLSAPGGSSRGRGKGTRKRRLASWSRFQ